MPEWIGLGYRGPVVLKGDLYQGNENPLSYRFSLVMCLKSLHWHCFLTVQCFINSHFKINIIGYGCCIEEW